MRGCSTSHYLSRPLLSLRPLLRYKTLTSADFKEFYLKYFAGKGVDFGKIDWDSWFNGYGMPPIPNIFDDSLVVVRCFVVLLFFCFFWLQYGSLPPALKGHSCEGCRGVREDRWS